MTIRNTNWNDPDKTTLDFIVVGAGAGGAPLAARLAERGFQVLVVEMGPKKPDAPPESVVDCVDVPLLHPETTEDQRHSLRYFVNHFGGVNEDRNPRRHSPQPDQPAIHPEDEEGVFYPRAQGLGGCTIHNAMITICGPSDDWDEIAEETGDPSWRGERMRAYFQRLENCNYDKPSWFDDLLSFFRRSMSWKTGRHGHGGWLQTTLSDLRLLVKEKKFFKVVASAALTSLNEGIESISELKSGPLPELDPNHWETMRRSQEGITRIPCSITPEGKRSSPRERLLAVQAKYPDLLHTMTGVLATKLLFRDESAKKRRKGKRHEPSKLESDKSPQKVVGIQVLAQKHVYEADVNAVEPAEDWKEQQQDLYCKRDVILCGGSFNTPQLLMLSGIGPREHLEKHQITPRVPLESVGQYLQDRYEIPIVATLADRFRSLDDVGLSSQVDSDPLLTQWRENRWSSRKTNVYSTNGGLIGIFKRSSKEPRIADLFMFALAGQFEGYQVGWSAPGRLAPEQGDASDSTNTDTAAREKRTLTWLVLKARSRNQTGTVELNSDSPFRRPKIDFNILPGDESENEDVQAIYEGYHFIEKLLQRNQREGLVESFRLPGAPPGLIEASDPERKQRLKKWIKDVAWGHHACGTCRIGCDPIDSVIDHRFRVHGTEGLRIVDASVFPRIPGYFIVTNIYMVSEKAADVISEDHHDHFESGNLSANVQANLKSNPIFFSNREARQRSSYPVQMEDAEARAIQQRRKVALRE